MNELDEIYTELIMEHSMNSQNKRALDYANCESFGHNPNCGDEIKLEAIVKNGIVEDIAFSGHGCAISQSSTSIMIDVLRGKTVEDAKQIVETYLSMIKRENLTEKQKEILKDAIAFENISNMPSRVKCATLSWHTFENLLNSLKK